MEKIILFIWFGDEKPTYTQWTLENFRQMNPGWEIKYIEYSNALLHDYKNLKDDVLDATTPNTCFSYWVDNYKNKYLSMNKDKFVIYCDLDCFPIAPFDNFIITDGMGFNRTVVSAYCKNMHAVYDLGVFATASNDKVVIDKDHWIKCNNKQFALDKVLQIHKDLIANEKTTVYDGIIINESKMPDFALRTKDFHDMKIKLGDNFCLPLFTLVEHYYSRERLKLNR